MISNAFADVRDDTDSASRFCPSGFRRGSTLARRAWLMVTVFALFSLVGCSEKLLIDTAPTGSNITVRPASNTSVIGQGTAPFEMNVDFGRYPDGYVVEAEPSAAMEQRYMAKSRAVTQADYVALPEVAQKKRRVLMRLDEKEYVIDTYVEVVLDSGQRWRGVVTRGRSYRDVTETGGAAPQQVVDFGENLGIQAMALSPDGKRIVYSRATYGEQANKLQKLVEEASPRPIDIAGANLHGVTVTGGGIQHITSENFRDMFPSFTTQGDKLLFSSNRRRPDSEDILMISSAGRSGISNIHVNPRDGRLLRPTQAEDGTIAFALQDPNPHMGKRQFTVWTIGGPNRFPTQIQTGRQPAISPDGKHIAYIGLDGNLWVVGVDGSQATQLTSGAEQILERYRDSLSPQELERYDWFVKEVGSPEKQAFSYPSWSSDGQHIVYTAMEGSDPTGRPNEDIWIMRFDGSGKRQLTTNGSIDRYPLLSPDGKFIYFMSNRGERWAIWRIPTSDLGLRH